LPARQHGMIKSYEDPGGNTTTLSYDQFGHIAQAQHGSVTFNFVFDPVPAAGNVPAPGAGMLNSVEMYINDEVVSKVAYSYYGDSDLKGNYNDLQQAVFWQLDTQSNSLVALDTSYYRYYINPGAAYEEGGFGLPQLCDDAHYLPAQAVAESMLQPQPELRNII